MVERDDEAPLTVANCAEVSRAVSAVLDPADIIRSAYTLEVSSPGIDRPLVKLKDFERFSGNLVRIELNTPVDGRRRFEGRLLRTEGVIVYLEMEGSSLPIPYRDIRRAKLVMNDSLLRASTMADHAMPLSQTENS
jgi:ribosome maturation factor RimP